MKKFKHLLILNFLFLNFFQLNSFYNPAHERIISFDSSINIQKDASIIVEETIKVNVEGHIIKRGIFRDFPTIYYDDLKNKYVIDFDIIEIKRNKNPEQYHIQYLSNGQRIYIGRKDYLLNPGIHTYTIKYKTNRQIGFFKNYDELYWNVTGNGWVFPIDKVTAIVNLPNEITENKIEFDGYTGYLDSKEKNFTAKIIDNKVIFETTKPLNPYQGLTISVVWEKGYINEPTIWIKIFYFLRDNKLIIWLITSLLLILFYYIYIYLKIRKPFKETIIPLFEPPDNLTPGQIRFINKMKYDDKIFTAEILDMAVNGFLKIEYKDQTYTLIKNKEPDKNSQHYNLFHKLFQFSEKLTLDKTNSKIINRAVEILKSDLYYKFQKKYFVPFTTYLSIGIVLSVLLNIPIFFTNPNYLFISIISFFLINIIFSYLLKHYTHEGNKIVSQIRGFKMFLSATEQERINFFAAPDRTPENFEIYLPYAVALDVEKKWTAQFKSVFEKLKEQNITYVPNWYIGKRFDALYMSNISSDINKSIHNIISSSAIPPGTTSGFGGKGSSGRGGGGGGGGGW